MTAQPDQKALAEATSTARTALRSCGADGVARLRSHPVTGAGYPDGTILTEVRLHLADDTGRITAALRGLPHVIDLWSAPGWILVLRSPLPTVFGPGGRDGLTAREAVRQSQLIHPDWSPATHVDWLIEDGYPLDDLDRATLEATVTDWPGTTPQMHRNPDAAGVADTATGPARPDGAAAPGTPALPPGARLLSADEAVERLVTGDHHGSDCGDLEIDGALIDAVRDGQIVACLFTDGRLAFTRAPHDPAATGSPATPAGPPSVPEP